MISTTDLLPVVHPRSLLLRLLAVLLSLLLDAGRVLEPGLLLEEGILLLPHLRSQQALEVAGTPGLLELLELLVLQLVVLSTAAEIFS